MPKTDLRASFIPRADHGRDQAPVFTGLRRPGNTTGWLRTPFLIIGASLAAVIAALAIIVLLFAGAFDEGLTTPLAGLDTRRVGTSDPTDEESRKRHRDADPPGRVAAPESLGFAAGPSTAGSPPPNVAPSTRNRPRRHSAPPAPNSPGNSEVSPGRPANPGGGGGNPGHQGNGNAFGNQAGHPRGHGQRRNSP